MNHTYRSVWNEATRTFIAAAESIKGRGRKSRSRKTSDASQGAHDLEKPASSRDIVPAGLHMLALEQRFMFDGAGMVDAIDTIGQAEADTHTMPDEPDEALALLPAAYADEKEQGQSQTLASSGDEEEALESSDDTQMMDSQPQHLAPIESDLLTADATLVWDQSIVDANRLLGELPGSDGYQTLLAETFGQHIDWSITSFESWSAELTAELLGGGLQVTVELRGAEELGGAYAAYATEGHTGMERIYVNADWINAGATTDQVTRVLLEELGHVLDTRLNAGYDTVGDEGELFALRVTGQEITEDQTAAILANPDQSTLLIEGVEVQVETAITAAAIVPNSITYGSDDPDTSDYVTNSQSQTIQFTITGSLTQGGYSIQYSLDGTSWTNATLVSGSTYRTNALTLPEGTTTISVREYKNPQSTIYGPFTLQTVTVDLTPPTATVTAGTIAADGSASVQSTEPGVAYLVNTNVTVTSLASITGAADNQWNSVTLAAANTATNLSAAGLAAGTYRVYTLDAAGNLSAASADIVTVEGSAVSDETPPEVEDVTLPLDGVYTAGQTLNFTIAFDEAVIVNTGDAEEPLLPYIELEVGPNAGDTRVVRAFYTSGSGTTALTFTYTVVVGDIDDDGIRILRLVDGEGHIKDQAGNVFDGPYDIDADSDVLLEGGDAPVLTGVAVSFPTVYQGTPSSLSAEANSLNNLQLVNGFDFRFVSADPEATTYSGNNVPGYLVYTDGATGEQVILYGEASRLFKSGGQVDGIYFYAYGADGLEGTGDDSAYLLVINDVFAPGGNEGTSSDPVNTALNAYLALQRSAIPVLDADTDVAIEAGDGENGADATGNVLANDTPASGLTVDRITFADASESVSHDVGGVSITGLYGTLTISADGGYVYVLDNANPTVDALNVDGFLEEVFEYRVVNIYGWYESATLTITIQGSNDAPVAVNDIVTAQQDTALVIAAVTLLGNDSDVDDLTLTIIGVTTGTGGTVRLANNGDIVFTPSSGFFGIGTFTYTVQDSRGSESTATVTVDVARTNDPVVPPPAEPPAPPPVAPAPVNEPVAPPIEPPPQPDAVELVDPGAIRPAVPEPAVRDSFQPQRFDSQLQAPGGFGRVPTPLGSFDNARVELEPWMYSFDMYTDQPNWRAVVLLDDGEQIRVFRGMTDQFVETQGSGEFLVPWDAFAHSKADAQVSLEAKLVDGQDLPDWIKFDPRTGTFSYQLPPNWRGDLVIRLVARDSSGNEVNTTFRLRAGERLTVSTDAPGRSGLHEQLREAARQRQLEGRAIAPVV